MDELLARAFDLNPVMMVVFSALSGTIMTVNQSGLNKIGLRLAEIAGMPLQNLAIWTAPTDIQFFFDLLRREREVSGYEIACRSPGGDPWFAQVSAAIMASEEEEYAVATFEDITKERQMKAKLRHGEEFFRMLAECAGDVIWVVDLEGRFIYMSHAIQFRMGYKPEEVIGQSFEPLVTPASAAIGRKLLEGVNARIKAGQHVGCQRVEMEMVRKHGSRFWAEINFCGMYGSDNKFIGLQGVSRDVSDRKRAEDEARENARMLADMAQNLPGAVFQFFVLQDGSKGFHYLSPRIQEMFDLPVEWRVGLNVHPDDYSQFIESVETAVKTESSWSFEGRFVLKSGEVRWFQGMAQPTKTENELIFNGVLLDITDRKRAEYALHEIDQRKDEFLAMLAHELRNPLAPVRNAVEVMKLSPANEATQARQQNIIEHQIQHMSRLIDDLLDVARITRGMIGLHKEIISLHEAAEQAIDTSMILLGTRKDDFSCELPEQNILVEADHTRLVQAIANLLGNAVKFSDRGQRIQLSITLEHSAGQGSGPEAVIQVEDQGMGIAPDLLPRIFDFFVQADKSLDRSRGGLGIGLTLTRRIIELHGGSIKATSAGLGKGSTFCLRLPAVLMPEKPKPKMQHHSEHKHPLAPTMSQARRNRILVVDDVIDEAKSLAELLDIWGYTVDTALDGYQAIEKVTDFSPGIVLLDIGLPKLDGYAVAQKIQQTVEKESILLICVSGYSSDKDRLKSLQSGCKYHLSKPIDLDQLRKIISEYVGSQA